MRGKKRLTPPTCRYSAGAEEPEKLPVVGAAACPGPLPQVQESGDSCSQSGGESVSPPPSLSLISPSVQICRTVDGGRVTSCKSAKDRTAMAVTLEQTHILLKEMKMVPSEQQHCLDTMRRSAIYHWKLCIVIGVFLTPPIATPTAMVLGSGMQRRMLELSNMPSMPCKF